MRRAALRFEVGDAGDAQAAVTPPPLAPLVGGTHRSGSSVFGRFVIQIGDARRRPVFGACAPKALVVLKRAGGREQRRGSQPPGILERTI